MGCGLGLQTLLTHTYAPAHNMWMKVTVGYNMSSEFGSLGRKTICTVERTPT